MNLNGRSEPWYWGKNRIEEQIPSQKKKARMNTFNLTKYILKKIAREKVIS